MAKHGRSHVEAATAPIFSACFFPATPFLIPRLLFVVENHFDRMTEQFVRLTVPYGPQ